MSFSKLNRAVIICAALGLFVAMVLSFQHLFGKEVPCMSGKGCLLVASHPSSYWGKIPVAFFGAFGYLAILALAGARAAIGNVFRSQLVLVGFLLCAFGFATSWYLQYVSKTVIFAFCPWCFTSAIIMTVLFGLHAKMYSIIGQNQETASDSRPDAIIASVGLAVALIGSFGLISTQNKMSAINEAVSAVQSTQLIATPGNILGDDKAKVTLVEFADLCCPACRTGFPKLMEFKQKYGDKIRVVYRHFPLFKIPGHEMSPLATVAAEVAADEGKFWQFASAFTSSPEVAKTPDEVFAIAEGVGVSRASIEKAAADSNSPASLRVVRDQECAIETLKVAGTPTYFLQYNGKTKKLNGEGLSTEMSSEEVQALLK